MTELQFQQMQNRMNNIMKLAQAAEQEPDMQTRCLMLQQNLIQYDAMIKDLVTVFNENYTALMARYTALAVVIGLVEDK